MRDRLIRWLGGMSRAEAEVWRERTQKAVDGWKEAQAGERDLRVQRDNLQADLASARNELAALKLARTSVRAEYRGRDGVLRQTGFWYGPGVPRTREEAMAAALAWREQRVAEDRDPAANTDLQGLDPHEG